MTAQPLPHYIGTERVLVLDFGARPDPEAARVGRPAQALLGIGGDTPYRHARLRFDTKGELTRDLPPTRGEQKPTLDDEHFGWQRHRPRYPIRAVVKYERAYASADCRNMVKMLDHVAKLAGKSTDPDALVQVRLSSTGVHLASLGAVSVSRDFPVAVDGVAPRDGLGSCVVLARALLDILKRNTGKSAIAVRLVLDPRSRMLQIGLASHALWTVNTTVTPALVPRRGSASPSPTSLKMVDALRRALAFASEDSARPNLNQVHVAFADSEVRLTSADGHNLYREVVQMRNAAADLGPKGYDALSGHSVGLPVAAAKRLTKGKNAWLSVSHDNPHWHWTREGCTMSTPVRSPTFPPADQVLATQRGMHETLLAPTHWGDLLAYAEALYNSKATTQVARLQFGQDQLKVCIRTSLASGDPHQIAAETFGVEGKEPDGEGLTVALAYFINALQAMPEGETLTIKHNPPIREKYDPVLFIAGGRTVLVMPRRP